MKTERTMITKRTAMVAPVVAHFHAPGKKMVTINEGKGVLIIKYSLIHTENPQYLISVQFAFESAEDMLSS